jgi:hypothetical protein
VYLWKIQREGYYSRNRYRENVYGLEKETGTDKMCVENHRHRENIGNHQKDTDTEIMFVV